MRAAAQRRAETDRNGAFPPESCFLLARNQLYAPIIPETATHIFPHVIAQRGGVFQDVEWPLRRQSVLLGDFGRRDGTVSRGVVWACPSRCGSDQGKS